MGQDLTNVHPELQPFAKRIPGITFSRRNIRLIRFLSRLNPAGKIPENISVENIHIPTKNSTSSLRLRVYRLRAMKEITPALIWIHGGGYILGTPEQNDEYCIHLVRATGVTVFSIDYRIAPFPTPLDDCYAALKWVADNNMQQKIDPHRIAVGGESAGGGLAAALAQLAVDRKEVTLIFQLLIYSMLDDRTVVRKDIVGRNFLVWNQKSNHFGWTSYLGRECGATEAPPYSVPARRDDLSALPPAWVGIGSLDLFHDENVAYAQRLKECGVPCELKVVQGGFHGFDLAGPQLNVVKDFRQSQVAALKKHLG